MRRVSEASGETMDGAAHGRCTASTLASARWRWRHRAPRVRALCEERCHATSRQARRKGSCGEKEEQHSCFSPQKGSLREKRTTTQFSGSAKRPFAEKSRRCRRRPKRTAAQPRGGAVAVARVAAADTIGGERAGAELAAAVTSRRCAPRSASIETVTRRDETRTAARAALRRG